MTAKQALRDIVDRLTEEQAAQWLGRMQTARPVPWRQRLEPPGWEEMATMSVEERREIFRRFPAEIDVTEFTEWEEGTIADSALIHA